jgi:gamma-glutamyl:cysteine ligase YbdK (ATP-grasp superfamily)
VIAGVPRSFKRDLQQLVKERAGEGGDVVQLDEAMTEWLVAQLLDDKRPARTRTSASKALWRAYSALSAARFHLENDSAEEERVRELRRKVEELWREVSPMFEETGDGDPEEDTGSGSGGG